MRLCWHRWSEWSAPYPAITPNRMPLFQWQQKRCAKCGKAKERRV
jgi:hypothetical protein